MIDWDMPEECTAVLSDGLPAVDPCDPGREAIYPLCVGARPSEIEGLVEEIEPAVKVLAGEGSLRMDQLVGLERIAGRGRPKRYRYQKSVSFGRCSDQSTLATSLNIGPRRSSWATSL